MPPLPAVILFGPTASGKTGLLESLFAKTGEAEVVSADSMQAYRGMDIGTAKPPLALREALPHHLIDIKEPSEQFSAGEFARLAGEACEAIHSRGRLPVLSGGAGFYLKNFIFGPPASPPSDAAIREKLAAEFRGDSERVLAELREADPQSVERIHPNDEYRLLRALEVLRLTGRPLSSFAANETRSGGKHRLLLIGLEWARDALYRRIDGRCRDMFRQGLPDEVRALFAKGYTPRDPGLKAIGYREFFVEDEAEDENGWRLSADIEGVETLTARNSRRYAKRQLTWFRNVDGVEWIAVDETADALKKATTAIRLRIARFLDEADG
jgi:tRNA dimethylallyltransferase